MRRDDEDASTTPSERGAKSRTLFFNFSHEAESDTASYYLVVGGAQFRLRHVKEDPAVLSRARRGNRFLRDIPDSAITHFAENVRLPGDSVAFGYVKQNPDPTSGTWNMSAMYFHLPPAAVMAAHRLAVKRFGSDSLPLSAKRKRYGHPPAATVRDRLEEEALKDVSDHAIAIVGMHPDLLSVEPTSAAHVQSNHISPNGFSLELSFVLESAGPATPQQTPGQPNATGWATLIPILDDNGQPFRNQNGPLNKGLIQYHPEWNAAIIPAAAGAVRTVVGPVKDDVVLGGDVTGQDPNGQGRGLGGALWKRHDGVTTVVQPGGPTAVRDTLAYTLTTQNTEGGFSCTGSAVAQSDGSALATLTFTNWFVRWLGIYLLFLDSRGRALDPKGIPVQLPSDYDGDPAARAALQNFAALFGLLLGPEFTLFAIPVQAQTATMTVTIPSTASTLRIFASGPSLRVLDSGDPNDPSTWGDWFPGVACTVLLNYGLTMLLMVAGASDKLSFIQKAALPLAASIVTDAANLLSDALRNKDFSSPDVWKQVALTTVKALITATVTQQAHLAVLIATSIALGEAEDCIPVAGQIMLGISLAAGAATLLETTVEIAESPVSYVYDLVLTHDLTVNILHASNNSEFPSEASYYKVTALFDGGGTPVVQTLDMPPGVPPGTPPSTLPPVVFQNVPRGGNVNVTVGFYSRSSNPTQNDWLAAKGTTGLVPNTDQLPDITIEEFRVPIRSTTVYEHKQKTTLLDAQGTHGWLVTPSGPLIKQSDISCENVVGQLCSFRGITVRQGTTEAPGDVGYAWQGSSAAVNACGGGQGQLDQLANIADIDPQTAYATGPCGFQPGVKLTYSLLAHPASNFYLDSTNGMVRQITLEPAPVFDPPQNQRAWGALNLESADLVLHPSGRLVSINNALGKIEVLKLPSAPMADADAKVKLLADVHAGTGSRPGLLNGPVAAAVSADGAILVLEGKNNRLQAFDLGANAVQFFSKQASPYFLSLDATNNPDTVYLDLAVEYTGYLYVLSYSIGSNRYRLDVYHPQQSTTNPITTTFDVNAAKLTVDFWRNVYTLNYDVLRLPGGAVPPITEPSVSLWAPSVP